MVPCQLGSTNLVCSPKSALTTLVTMTNLTGTGSMINTFWMRRSPASDSFSLDYDLNLLVKVEFSLKFRLWSKTANYKISPTQEWPEMGKIFKYLSASFYYLIGITRVKMGSSSKIDREYFSKNIVQLIKAVSTRKSLWCVLKNQCNKI